MTQTFQTSIPFSSTFTEKVTQLKMKDGLPRPSLSRHLFFLDQASGKGADPTSVKTNPGTLTFFSLNPCYGTRGKTSNPVSVPSTSASLQGSFRYWANYSLYSKVSADTESMLSQKGQEALKQVKPWENWVGKYGKHSNCFEKT